MRLFAIVLAATAVASTADARPRRILQHKLQVIPQPGACVYRQPGVKFCSVLADGKACSRSTPPGRLPACSLR